MFKLCGLSVVGCGQTVGINSFCFGPVGKQGFYTQWSVGFSHVFTQLFFVFCLYKNRFIHALHIANKINNILKKEIT